MANLTELIKDLRNKTGSGFLDCKNALSENNNDIEKAVDYLRKKGLAKASKKTSREANEGAIGIFENTDLIVILKINSETDFAAKSDTFLNFLNELGNFALDCNNIDLNINSFLNTKYKDTTIADYFKNMIAKIGENLILSDLKIMKIGEDLYSYYVHNSYLKNVGKIVSVIKYKTKNNDEEIKNLSKNICMHIAAMKPESLDINDLDEDIINKEKDIQKDLIVSSGKPQEIIEKILEGKMKKFYSEVTLYNQPYILDQEKTIKSLIKDYANKYEYELVSYNLISLT